MTGRVMTLNDSLHQVKVTGGVHAEAPGGRSFDTPEVTYNTQSDDFKMLGGITAFFPLRKPSPTPTPFATPSGLSGLSPDVSSPFAPGATPAQFGSPPPKASPTPSPTPSP